MATVKKYQAGGVSTKKVKAPMVDPSGAWTKVQERTLGNMKKGGKVMKKKAAKGGSFPDLNKDGKITKADILVGRGVIKAKKGAKMTTAKGGKWIQKAIKKPGALRSQLGAKPGKPIPAGKLAKAAKAPGKLGQRARLAMTLKKMRKK